MLTKRLMPALYVGLLLVVAALLVLSSRWQQTLVTAFQQGQLIYWQHHGWQQVQDRLAGQRLMYQDCLGARVAHWQQCEQRLTLWLEQPDALAYRFDDAQQSQQRSRPEWQAWWQQHATEFQSADAPAFRWLFNEPRPLLLQYWPLFGAPGEPKAGGVWLLTDVTDWLRLPLSNELGAAWVSNEQVYPVQLSAPIDLAAVQWQPLANVQLVHKQAQAYTAVAVPLFNLALVVQGQGVSPLLTRQTLVILLLSMLTIAATALAYWLGWRRSPLGMFRGLDGTGESGGDSDTDMNNDSNEDDEPYAGGDRWEQGRLVLDAQGRIIAMNRQAGRWLPSSIIDQELVELLKQWQPIEQGDLLSLQTLSSQLNPQALDNDISHSNWQQLLSLPFAVQVGETPLWLIIISVDQHTHVVVTKRMPQMAVATDLPARDAEQLPGTLSGMSSPVGKSEGYTADEPVPMDPISGVFNRDYLNHLLPHEIDRCRRDNQELSAILLTIDNYAFMAEQHGLATMRYILRRMAVLLEQQLARGTDVLGHYHKSAFCILLPNTPADYAIQLAHKLQELLMADQQEWQVIETLGEDVHQSVVDQQDYVALNEITFSIGVYAMTPDMHTRAEDFWRQLSAAMHKAHGAGANQIQFMFDE